MVPMRRVRNGHVGERGYCQHPLPPDRRALDESHNAADHDWPGLIPNICAQEDLQDTPVLQTQVDACWRSRPLSFDKGRQAGKPRIQKSSWWVVGWNKPLVTGTLFPLSPTASVQCPPDRALKLETRRWPKGSPRSDVRNQGGGEVRVRRCVGNQGEDEAYKDSQRRAARTELRRVSLGK